MYTADHELIVTSRSDNNELWAVIVYVRVVVGSNFFRFARRWQVANWLCPITGLLMTDPVTAEDGFIYERSAIEKWFSSGFLVSPKTGQEIGKSLESNSDLYQIIKSFKAFLRNTDSSLDLTLAHPGPDGNAQSITLSRGDVCETEPVQMFPALSAFFKELHRVEGLLESTLTGLIPLKIAIVGGDSWLIWA